MKSTPFPLRIPGNLMTLADLRAREDRVDRSTALRQLLFGGALDYVLALLARGRISLSKAAELLDCSTLAVIEKAREQGVSLGDEPDPGAGGATHRRRRARTSGA